MPENMLIGMVRCKEYELYRHDSSTLKRICTVIKQLFKREKFVTMNLKAMLEKPLKDFYNYLEGLENRNEFFEQIDNLKDT